MARMVRGMLEPRIVAREDGEGHASPHRTSSHGQGVGPGSTEGVCLLFPGREDSLFPEVEGVSPL